MARHGQLAHHPPGNEFRHDVFHVGRARLCVGCFTTFPVFLVAFAALLAAPIGPWWLGFAYGAPLAAMQFVSSLGVARWRWLKVAVKTCLGVGMALAVHATLASPWPAPGRVLALLAMLLLAALSAMPRQARIARMRSA